MTNLITENIAVWTSAQAERTNSAGRGNGSSGQKQYGIKKLRELILELAVRGKLVPQDPNDEPASVLLERIANEKARLIKKGKIKKQEPLPGITEDEKPFELPRGWEWVRLGGVTEFVNGYAFKSSDFSDTGVGIVKIGDIQNGEITTASMSRVEENIVAGLDDSLKVNNGDMLIAMSGATTGKLGFNRTNEVFYINQRVGKIIPYCLYVEYLYHPLTTKISENLAKSMGSAIPNLSTAQIKDIVFALPPLPEQHRIVAKVDELMALCDQLEQKQSDSDAAHRTLVETLLAALTTAANQGEFADTWQRIAEHFDTLFTTEHSIDQFKQTILQLAVMGKLVPQNPDDEPASVLLEKIAKEKARLVKEGKIKKEKPLPEIKEADKPFEVPVGWEWTRLGYISYQITDGTHYTPAYVTDGVPFLSVKDLSSGYLDFSKTRFISPEQHEEFAKRCNPQRGDLLLTKVGTTGIPVLVNTDRPFSIFVSVALIKFPQDQIFGKFFVLLAKSPLVKIQSEQGTEGIGNKNLVLRKITVFLIVIPPLAEQHRIVAKVDELMALCDALNAQLKDAQTTQLQLADAIVEQVVA